MEESVFVSKILNELDGDDYLMVEKLLNLRSESLANQFKDDVSRVFRSNNNDSRSVCCNNDSRSKIRIKQPKTNDCGSGSLKFCMLESKNHEVAACRRDERVGKMILKIRTSDLSARVDFVGNVGTKNNEAASEKSLSDEGSEKKHIHEVVACRHDESVGKRIIKIRTNDRSLRVDFGNLDLKNREAAAEETSSDEGSKKEMKKRKATDERSSKPSKKRKNPENNNNVNDQIEEEYPELPLAFKEKIEQMEGSEVKLVIQKKLTVSDVTKSKSRFSIPIKKMIKDCNFLRPEEESSLDYARQKKTDGKKLDGMLVSVLDPNLILHDGICFKKWKMAKNNEIYNLTKKWNHLVAKNRFKEKEKVQLWSFRSHKKLYFALVKLQPRSISQ
ncbi:B3 domain-containing protein [Trifolium pratense]|uniref:B3 domain-containing protein n=1 Tax=Trifolium pratense TaxID=57577 RepID=A0A2K3MPF2_TRIPR|nr:B3 domain-containing protein [Trifolium pratense]